MKSNENPDAAPTAEAGDTVKIHYTCKLDDGSLFSTTKDKEPLEFVLGEAQVIPGLQEAVLGMTPGEKKTQKLPPEKAYGPYHEEMTATLDRKMLPEDIEIKIGVSLRLKHADGHESEAFVTDLTEKTVTVDGNHPLAGKNLIMEIELVNLVEA